MQVLRTPDERFDSLPDFPFAAHYAQISAGTPDEAELRMAYLDEAPHGGPGHTIVLLHGEPSWSFLYRKMIPVLTEAGHRCIAPDLIGFGRSDKPTELGDYSFAAHVEWVRQLLFDHLDLRDVVLFGQDWGGMIGLRLVGEHPERFSRVVIGNSGLPTGSENVPDALLAWQKFAREADVLPIGDVIRMGCAVPPPPEVIAAYEAPFPDPSFTAGAKQFPSLIPVSPDDPAAAANNAAWESLGRFEKPFLCAFSDGDPLTAGADKKMLREIPGTAGQPHTTIEGGGHFLQEDRGPELARVIADWLA